MFHPHLVEDTLSAQYGIPSRRVYPQLCADAHDSSLCGGRLLWDSEGFRLCGGDQRTEPVWRLCDRPLETFARPFPIIGCNPTLAGRGGSVSRRDHNQLAGNRAQLAWGRKLGGKVKLIPSCSSGEGVWGRGASLREAASPPESPPP